MDAASKKVLRIVAIALAVCLAGAFVLGILTVFFFKHRAQAQEEAMRAAYARAVAEEKAATQAADQRQRARSDAGPCACLANDPLCSCP